MICSRDIVLVHVKYSEAVYIASLGKCPGDLPSIMWRAIWQSYRLLIVNKAHASIIAQYWVVISY